MVFAGTVRQGYDTAPPARRNTHDGPAETSKLCLLARGPIAPKIGLYDALTPQYIGCSDADASW
ncbi:hypothetical protein SSOG_08169 [Streptomyces himastatinicus ATCC 53653]|uniref:Uncharacterized protein n=1 Tax=Streptomyces himastatinicus ATCC 53653 TaxID=457427 RepID=D9WTR1_9ACTN|nr:hypothetical protein SSOG_08169 [Streptomyces himastatinicus ATCC 53653]